MKRISVLSTLAVSGASAAAAQDTPQQIIFGEYMYCSPAQQERADEILINVRGPIIQKHVASGQLTGWIMIRHVQGGAWRRAVAMNGTDLDQMMDARAQIVQEFRREHPAAGRELATICDSHDDYIWTGVVTSPPPTPGSDAGPASISTYYVCDGAKETRADGIFERLLAPLYEKHTNMGHLTGWGFWAHRAGGPYRRLETFRGADHKTLLRMQGAIYQEAQQTDPLAFNEFREICGSHVDYMWMSAPHN